MNQKPIRDALAPLFSTLNVLKASWSPGQWREYQEGWSAAQAAVANKAMQDARAALDRALAAMY